MIVLFDGVLVLHFEKLSLIISDIISTKGGPCDDKTIIYNSISITNQGCVGPSFRGCIKIPIEEQAKSNQETTEHPSFAAA